MNEALVFSGVDAYYGDSLVLRDVSFRLGEGRLLGLLGRNGAGKTTCLRVAVGLLTPRRGEVEYFSSRVTHFVPEELARLGVALVPQGRRVFKSLSVGENLAVAQRRPSWSKQPPWTRETVFAAFPRLRERESSGRVGCRQAPLTMLRISSQASAGSSRPMARANQAANSG